MEIKNSHAVPHGPSLIDKIRDELDLAYEIWADEPDESESNKSYAQGIALALGILRSSSEDEEWRLAEERFNES